MAESITPEAIASIWQAQGLGSVRTVVRASGGVVNEAFVVNDGWVLRCNTRDRDVPKFANERRAFDLLAGRGVPIPRVVAYDGSCVTVPYEYIILDRLPGRMIVGDAPEEIVPSIAREAGCYLAMIHSVALPGFGKVRDLADRSFVTWADYFGDYFARYLRAAEWHAILSSELAAELAAVLERAAPLFARVTQGVLVHSDYHYANILHDSGRITGVLDFEWALSGDPVFDLAYGDYRERTLPGSEDAFLAGYRSVRELDDEASDRLWIYRLAYSLDIAVDAARAGDLEVVQSERESLTRQLADGYWPVG